MRQRKRRERAPICCFILHMPVTARIEPGWIWGQDLNLGDAALWIVILYLLVVCLRGAVSRSRAKNWTWKLRYEIWASWGHLNCQARSIVGWLHEWGICRYRGAVVFLSFKGKGIQNYFKKLVEIWLKDVYFGAELFWIPCIIFPLSVNFLRIMLLTDGSVRELHLWFLVLVGDGE